MSSLRLISLVLATTVSMVASALAQGVAVPFRSTEWRYIVPTGSIEWRIWSTPEYDDSGWTVGAAPFGDQDRCDPISTIWASGPLVARHRFTLAGGQPSQIFGSVRVRITDHGQAYLNGGEIMGWSNSSGDCREYDGGTGNLLRNGDNIVMVHTYMTNPPGFFDLELTVTGATSTSRGSWGRLKSIYR